MRTTQYSINHHKYLSIPWQPNPYALQISLNDLILRTIDVSDDAHRRQKVHNISDDPPARNSISINRIQESLTHSLKQLIGSEIWFIQSLSIPYN